MSVCSDPKEFNVSKDSFGMPDYHEVSPPGMALFDVSVLGQATSIMAFCMSQASGAVSSALGAINSLGNTSMPAVTTYVPSMDIGGIPSPNINVGSFIITDPASIPDPHFPFDFNEDYYQSPLQDAIQAKLLNDIINGGTGLNADIEAEMMARETERDNLLLQDAIDKVSVEWSKRRMPLPNGQLAASIRRVYVEWLNTRLDKSRKIAEDSHKTAIENTRWANDTGVKLEEIKMDYKTNYWKRKLDGSLGVVNAGVQVFDSYVKKFVAHYEGMKAKAQAYSAQAQASAAIAGIDAEILKARVMLVSAQGDVAVKAMDVDARIAEATARLAIEAASAAAQAASHIAAGALSAIHVSSSASATGSISQSSNFSKSSSSNESINYNESSGVNTSRSVDKRTEDSQSCIDYYAHEEEEE